MQEDTADTNDPKIMGLMDHIGELRTRLVKSFLAILALFVVAMSFANPLLDFLQEPLRQALPNADNLLHFTSPLEPFIAQIKVGLLMAFLGGAPVWIYQFWRFIEPALYDHEKKYILPFTLASIALFAAGVMFCFFIILPMALSFLISLGQANATAIITISDYISMVMILIFAFGFIFETPLILILCALLELIEAKTLEQNRKIVFVGILILAAVITPPDPISQLAMAAPTYLMFEVAVLIIKFIEKRKAH